MDDVMEQPIMGVMEGALCFQPADSVFHLILLDIPLIPVKLNFPYHQASIAHRIM
jgi:hypothetical protein